MIRTKDRGPAPDGPVAGVVRRLEVLRPLRGTPVPRFCTKVRDLVVVASSSRGGSSMLSELLRSSPHLLHLRGELNPLLRLVGLDHPHSGTGSDALDAAHWHGLPLWSRALFEAELSLDAGSPGTGVENLAVDAAWRLVVQWPGLDLDPVDLVRTAEAVLDRDLPRFARALIGRAGVNPLYYDLPGRSPGPRPAGPPGDVLLEEPPFVLPRPWRPASEHDLATKPLVVKTPGNAYRLGFLRAVFPNARLRVLHLTRNPAASVNGLVDGWLHHGFHAYRMDEPLRIAGYADVRPADRHWWKFDLPPCWSAYTAAALPRVCAHQWWSSHRAVLAHGADHTVRFEDLISGPHRRADAVERVAHWLGVPYDGPLKRTATAGIPATVSTAAPRPGRWRAREAEVRSALSADVLAMAERLGYARDDHWI
ncbi:MULTISPECIES: sulfotransferase [unclassified Streptomyces]|uniref:sulfotransferase n=1 Tax=unclassified Streptomyces TaxID=2593676 RepID=UPI000AFD7399|nr:sulfotransferase [Streptomyces sp. MnatMP-M77]MYT77925.1 sulfotransferase [Streptomyces sp. SID8364]